MHAILLCCVRITINYWCILINLLSISFLALCKMNIFMYIRRFKLFRFKFNNMFNWGVINKLMKYGQLERYECSDK